MSFKDINVSKGCKADFVRLISNFVEAANVSNSSHFSVFAEEWRKAHFNYLFCGREELVELSEFIKQLFTIVKSLLLENVGILQRIGALYLCYSMYYRQEKTRNKLRFTLPEFSKMLELMEDLKKEGHEDAQYIFYQLLVDNAIHFTATPIEFNHMDMRNNSSQEADNVEKPESDLLNKFNDKTMKELEVIHSYYMTVKSSVPDLLSQQASSRATVNAAFVKLINQQLEGLKTNMRLSLGEAAKRVKKHGQDSDSDGESDDSILSDDIPRLVKKQPNGIDK